MKLIFDTETTGLARFDLPINSPLQPRLVQLGMMMLSSENEVLHEVGLIIKPEGFEIPEFVSNIHGITQEKAVKYGVSLKGALSLFVTLAKSCEEFIGHNLRFDTIVLSSELSRLNSADYNFTENKKTFCTMLRTVDVCRLPNKNGRSGYKWPKLSEAYTFLFNESIVSAHTALGDVRSTMRVYNHLMSAELKMMNPALYPKVPFNPLVNEQV